MPANQAEVVGEHMAIQLVAELGPERTTANATGQAAKNGAGQRTEGDAQRTGNGADCRAGLAAGQRGGCTACCATIVPTKAPIFMAGCRDAILGELQRGHCNDIAGRPPWWVCHCSDIELKFFLIDWCSQAL